MKGSVHSKLNTVTEAVYIFSVKVCIYIERERKREREREREREMVQPVILPSS